MKQPKFPFDKLKKLDEYAKSLGMTIYRVDYGFMEDNKEHIHGMVGLNNLSERYYNFIGCTNQYKKCLET